MFSLRAHVFWIQKMENVSLEDKMGLTMRARKIESLKRNMEHLL